MVFVILFSLGTVAAGENVTSDISAEDILAVGNGYDSNGYLDDGLSESQDILKADSSNDVSDNDSDLIVKIDVKNVYVGNKFNRAGYEIPWTITALVNGEIAHNTKVYNTFSDNMAYVSHDATAGKYDPDTGIWEIGDLSSSNNASLTILTKLKQDGRFVVTANATTDSTDINLSNNYKSLYTRSGTSQVKSNTTETSDDKSGANHDSHFASESSGLMDVERSDETQADNSNTDSEIVATKSKADKNSESVSSSSPASSSSSNDAVAVNDLDSVTNQISSTIESVSNSIIDIFTPGSSDDDSDSNASSSSVSKAISAQDYTKIPMLIFALFLIITLPVIAYDKIKS